jgi:hypothetical protein
MISDQKAGWTFMVNGRLTTVCAAARPNESAVVHRCTGSSLAFMNQFETSTLRRRGEAASLARIIPALPTCTRAQGLVLVASSGEDYSVFPTIGLTRKAYAGQRLGVGGVLCRVSTKSSSPWLVGWPPLPASALQPCYGWVDTKPNGIIQSPLLGQF